MRPGGKIWLLVLAVAAAVFLAAAGVAYARFTDTASIASNTFVLDTLNAPTALTATGGASVTLDWTPTTDTYASGHRVFRGTASGGPYSQIAQVTPRTTATYVDSPGAGSFYYVLRAYYQNWESVDGNQASSGNTGLLNCSANAAVTSGSGDDNGFQTTPEGACADGTSDAADANSGTTTAATCADSSKDRHLYYDYGASIPASSTINGIAVRLEGEADSTSGAPFWCVELSWDGGTSWTAAKTTATLGITQAAYTLGGFADTWGRSWSATDLSNANFQIRITSVATNIQRDFDLDRAAVRVTYTPP